MGLFYPGCFARRFIYLQRRPGRPNRQDAGETEPDGAECALPQGLAALRQVLVQPARQEDPQEGRARREGQAGCPEAGQVSPPGGPMSDAQVQPEAAFNTVRQARAVARLW